MKKKFKFRSENNSVLIAQTAEADVHLQLEPSVGAVFVVKTDNSRMTSSCLVKVAQVNDSIVGRALAAGLAAMKQLGLRAV